MLHTGIDLHKRDLVATTLDATGHVTGTTVSDTKTTLIEATDQDYALRVEVTVDVELEVDGVTVKLIVEGAKVDCVVTTA